MTTDNTTTTPPTLQPPTLYQRVLDALPGPATEIAERLEANREVVYQCIAHARRKGVVRHVGSTKGRMGSVQKVWDRVEGQP